VHLSSAFHHPASFRAISIRSPVAIIEPMSSSVGNYRLGPFFLESEIPLPELPELDAPTAHDPATPHATIRIAPVPQSIPDVVAHETRWFASRDEYLLRVPNVANFLVRNGREVLVEPAPNALPLDIRAYLLSPIFSTLCHQAGMYSLHASSIRSGEGVAAFLGDSGAGKSTLAASLAQRGYSVVSDDICLLDPQPRDLNLPGDTLVVPVAPSLKLWRSALEALGQSPESLTRVFSTDDKYRLKLPNLTAPHQPATRNLQPATPHFPLTQIFFLEWSDTPDEPPSIIPIHGAAALTRLMEFTHYDYLMKATGRKTGNFLLCGRILSQARAFTLRRPRNFAQLGSTLDTLLTHLTPTHLNY
jgi:hypothetical protein